jgi:hypothetical protein
MNRKTLLAGAVFAGLLLIAYAVLRQPEKGTRQGAGERPVPAIAAGSFDTLEVTKDGKTTVIKKEGPSYKVTAPVAYAAEQESAKQAFEAIEKLEFDGSPVSDQKAKHDEYEVGAKGLRVTAKKGAQTLADLRVGKVTNGLTMIRVEGKDDVWKAIGTLKYQLDKDSAGWRDKSITTFEQNEAEKLEVVSKTDGKIVLVKPPKGDASADSEWKVTESTVKVTPFDKSVPTDMISALYSWKTSDFSDDAKPADSGLDAPELTVTVTLKGGKTQTVLIGKKKGEEDYYVKRADLPQVFLVKKFNIERINKRPIEFRDKTICDLTAAEITQLAVGREKDGFTLAKDPKGTGDAAWKLVKPTGLTLDTSKVSNVVGGFNQWKATSFAADSAPKATGLDKPTATVNAVSNVKGHGCSVKIGAELPDKQNQYVAVAGSPDVFVAPKWSLERILPKLDDLKKK